MPLIQLGARLTTLRFLLLAATMIALLAIP